jgi:hypothetical protein
VMNKFLETCSDEDRTTKELAKLPCRRDIVQDVRSRALHGLRVPDVVALEIEGMGDQHQAEIGAESEDNDNSSDNDTALLLSVCKIVDHDRSRRDTAGVVHQRLARTAQQTEEDLEQEDISDE